MDYNFFEDIDKTLSDENKIRSNPCHYITLLEQSEENCLLAVSLNFDALRKIPKTLHTEKLCLVAIRQCGYALKYVSKKIITEELCLEAVKTGNIKVRYVTPKYNVFDFIPSKFLTPEFYAKSYEVNHDILPHIPQEFRDVINCKNNVNNNTIKALEDATKEKGITPLQMMRQQEEETEAMCFLAIKNNPLDLRFVPERFKTLELCEIALEQDLRCIHYFPEKLLNKDYVKKWLINVIDIMNARRLEYEEKYDKVEARNRYDHLYYNLKRIVEELPSRINNNREIIKLQRILGFRVFTSKRYDAATKKFVTREMIPGQCFNEEKVFSNFKKFYQYVDCELSEAELYDFDFKKIKLKDINIKGALIPSEILIAQNVYDDTYYNSTIPANKTALMPLDSIKNEIIDAQSLVHVDDIESQKLNDKDVKFYYISDIHLMHKIKNKFPEYGTKEEIEMYVKKVVKSLVNSAQEISLGDYILIGGDVSCNFDIAKLFYTELSKRFRNYNIIAILGNHELWDAKIDNSNDRLKYNENDLEEIIDKYRKMFEELKINFMHNQLLALEEGEIRISTEEQLQKISEQKLKEIALKSPFLLVAGIGFSGYDPKYNATCGLYRNKITTIEEDQIEAKKFEKLYSKLKQCIPNEKLIIFTHTPKHNWSQDNYNKNWIYVNGHTHRNEYTMDDEKTVYSDNQIGYKSTSFGLKTFKLSASYDTFKYYEDGKYEIKRELYNEFNRGMKIKSTCNRADGVIYMLKKHNNYCFFFKKNNKLYCLDGGRINQAEHQDIDYYYERLDIYSNAVKNMLSKYNSALKQISNEIKKIGGSGNIHGCIVDIDYYNHIYLNPIDGSITPYYATDIVNKRVYPSMPALLKSKVPMLYKQYLQIFSDNEATISLTVLKDNLDAELSRCVFDTDMYSPSGVMKSLQYITEANIIRNWNDDIINKLENRSIDEKTIQISKF